LIYKKERDEWLLPKGHVNENEEIEAAAIREIQEETGYHSIAFSDKDISDKTEYEFEADGEKNFKVVYYYLVNLLDESHAATKEQEDEGLGGAWFTFPQAIELIAHEDAKRFIAKAQTVCR